MVGSDNNGLVVLNDSPGVMDLLNVPDLSDYLDMSVHHFVEGLDDVLVVGESVSPHNMVQFVDHSVGMSSSMSDYGV